MTLTPEMIEAAIEAADKCLAAGFTAQNTMKAALTAALSAAWRPIESAPKDETPILIGAFSPHGAGLQAVVTYDGQPPGGSEYVWRTDDGIGYHRDLPTHWQPLPPPPEERKE
jgi:hypothetical protein